MTTRPTDRELLEQIAADVAALRAEVAAFGEQATTLRTLAEVSAGVRAAPAPPPRRRPSHLHLTTGGTP